MPDPSETKILSEYIIARLKAENARLQQENASLLYKVAELWSENGQLIKDVRHWRNQVISDEEQGDA